MLRGRGKTTSLSLRDFMLAKIKQFVKDYQSDIILVIGVILISLFSFALGYILAKTQEKEPIRIEYRDTNILMHTNDTNKRKQNTESLKPQKELISFWKNF